jgi:hypothetical protein
MESTRVECMHVEGDKNMKGSRRRGQGIIFQNRRGDENGFRIKISTPGCDNTWIYAYRLKK